MPETGARARRAAERRQQILDAARAVAGADGWGAVTSRRLADAIGYTQPVLYAHFPGGKTEIMRTVALAGFAELATATRAAVERKTGAQAVAAVAGVYLDFAAQDDAEAELRTAFNALAAALDDDGDGTATEVLWSSLHGMSLLERAGRMRPGHRRNRIAELAARFGG
jgi:AcrR family transcriptional regulator